MLLLYATKNIYPAYVSKRNWNLWKQVILLMIPNRGRWHYFAVKSLSALLWGITSKHHGDFYYLNCLYSFATENILESQKNTCA